MKARVYLVLKKEIVNKEEVRILLDVKTTSVGAHKAAEKHAGAFVEKAVVTPY